MAHDDEFSLIRRHFVRAPSRQDVTLGVGDDAAILQPAPGHELVMTIDNLTAGVHFPVSLAAADVGFRSLAVNLSDLAAMGATPCWATLALSLPSADEDWLADFAAGFFELAAAHDLALVGGDTVRGPLSVTVQLTGQVPAGTALRRDGACPGDAVVVSGPLGLAALGLRLMQQGIAAPPAADQRFRRPLPRIALGLALRGRASSCIDLSDGLAADLTHVLEASGAGATLDENSLPLPAPLDGVTAAQRVELALGGGDDYELCFTCDPARMADWDREAVFAGCRTIGRIEAAPGLRLRHGDGTTTCLGKEQGYRHF